MDPSSSSGPTAGEVVDRAVAARVLREVADLLDTFAPVTDLLRAAQTGRDVLDVLRVAGVAGLQAPGAHDDEGASTVTTWARREPPIDAAETARPPRTAPVPTLLPTPAPPPPQGLL